MNPETLNIESAEKGNALDIQNQYNFRKQLGTQLNEFDNLRNQRKMDNLALAGATPNTPITNTSIPTVVPPTEPIDASALGTVKSVNFPQPQVSGTAPAVLGEVESTYEGIKTKSQEIAEQQKLAASTEKDTKKKSIEDTFKELVGVKEKELEIRKELGIDDLVSAKDKFKEDYDRLDRAQQNEIRALEQQPGTMAQKAQRQADIERQYAFQKADIALELDIAERRVDRAENTLTNRMNLMLEPLKMQLEMDKFWYNELKTDFTKAEEREFDAILAQEEREIKKIEETENTRKSLLLSAMTQGAPQSVINAIKNGKTVEEAIQAAGQYGADILERQIKQAQLDKLNVELSALNEADIIATPMTPYEKEKQTRVLNAVDDLMGRTSLQTVGFASLGRMLPASLPRNFKTDLDTLKANIAFGELTAMRSASKTGGALGQVSERELALLEASLAGLDQGQSPSSFKKNLQQVKDSLARWYGAVDGLSEEQQLRAAGYTEEQILQIKNSQ